MRNIRLLALLLVPFFVMAIIAGTASAAAPKGKANSPSNQDNNRNFVTSMSGREETPPVTTTASGVSIFHLSKDGLSMEYKLIANDIISVTAGHIHTGTFGVPGPVVVTLVSPSACTVDGTQIKCEGTFTAANFVGQLAGHPMSDLVAMMREGRAYTNVHTSAHPSGEIRGQLGRGPHGTAGNQTTRPAGAKQGQGDQHSCNKP